MRAFDGAKTKGECESVRVSRFLEMGFVKRIVWIIVLFMLLTACGDQYDIDDNESTEYVMSEVRNDDFVLQVFATKQTYALGEEVEILAKLKYVGENSSQIIYHAASPFHFYVSETTRQVAIPFMMDQPRVLRELKKDIWYIEAYKKIGGIYSEIFPGYEFHNEFADALGFPEGNYNIEVNAIFDTDETSSENKQLSTSIRIKVGEYDGK